MILLELAGNVVGVLLHEYNVAELTVSDQAGLPHTIGDPRKFFLPFYSCTAYEALSLYPLHIVITLITEENMVCFPVYKGNRIS